MPRLYLETTIPSYLVGRPSRDLRVAADQAATSLWWEHRREMFEMFVSAIVLYEVSRGDEQIAALRVACLKGLPILEPSDASESLTERMLLEGVVPASAAADAAHIALAAVHSMDFLLTWNCKHINNRFAFRRIERACAMIGYKCPVIATPTELMNLDL